MLIKTQGLASVPYGFFDCASETYEIWVNPAFVTSVLPELKSIKLLGEEEYTKLTDDGFGEFIKLYEKAERAGMRGVVF